MSSPRHPSVKHTLSSQVVRQEHVKRARELGNGDSNGDSSFASSPMSSLPSMVEQIPDVLFHGAPTPNTLSASLNPSSITLSNSTPLPHTQPRAKPNLSVRIPPPSSFLTRSTSYTKNLNVLAPAPSPTNSSHASVPGHVLLSAPAPSPSPITPLDQLTHRPAQPPALPKYRRKSDPQEAGSDVEMGEVARRQRMERLWAPTPTEWGFSSTLNQIPSPDTTQSFNRATLMQDKVLVIDGSQPDMESLSSPGALMDIEAYHRAAQIKRAQDSHHQKSADAPGPHHAPVPPRAMYRTRSSSPYDPPSRRAPQFNAHPYHLAPKDMTTHPAPLASPYIFHPPQPVSTPGDILSPFSNFGATNSSSMRSKQGYFDLQPISVSGKGSAKSPQTPSV